MKKLFSFIVIILLVSSPVTSRQQNVAKVVESQFLYETAQFPSCHASTIAEADNGDLLVAYFGGEYEGAKDVCIWLSRKKYGTNTWDSPVKIADGTVYRRLSGDAADTEDKDKKNIIVKACYNPVLFKMPDGKIVLFFKIGENVQDWTGWYSVSSDNGYTWTDKEPLPDGFLGPIKNKPELIGNKLVCPSSTEKGWWQIHFEIFDLAARTWQYVGPVKAAKAVSSMNMPKGKKERIICIQPSILKLPDGRLQVLCRTKNSALATSYSKDGGWHWSKVKLTSLPNNNSGTDAVTLSDGRHVLVYNDVRSEDGEEMGKRTPLVVAVFDKDMKQILQKIVLEDEPNGEFSYPAVIQGKNGNVFITYTWKRQRIAFKEVSLE